MKKKHLVLLSHSYPNADGEYFLDDEVKIIADRFETITVICSSVLNQNSIKTPPNVKVICPSHFSLFRLLMPRFLGLFFLPLWIDLFSVRKRFGIYPTFFLFKLLWADFVKSSSVMYTLQTKKLINPDSHILYSYWHDHKALALARIRKKYPTMIAIARGHGWDVDYKRHNPQYLPYKNFLVAHLSKSISISDFGKRMLDNIVEKKYHQNIIVSKLGKVNHRISLDHKLNKEEILICSCSSIIPLKRIDKIIELLSNIKNKKLRWVHFGDGQQLTAMKDLAQQLLLNATFMGNVENHIVLDFYSLNYVDLFINLSESEGIPVSIMEAQSAGIPVLATNVGGTSEIVNNDNGFLIDKDYDINEVVEKINRYFDSPFDEIKAKRQASNLNWKKNYNGNKNYTEFAKLILNH